MNQSRTGKSIDGVLEVIIKEKTSLKIRLIIYASKIKNNSVWEYYTLNGQTIEKESPLNPRQMAIALGKEYQKKNLNGEIHWKYIPN